MSLAIPAVYLLSATIGMGGCRCPISMSVVRVVAASWTQKEECPGFRFAGRSHQFFQYDTDYMDDSVWRGGGRSIE